MSQVPTLHRCPYVVYVPQRFFGGLQLRQSQARLKPRADTSFQPALGNTTTGFSRCCIPLFHPPVMKVINPSTAAEPCPDKRPHYGLFRRAGSDRTPFHPHFKSPDEMQLTPSSSRERQRHHLRAGELGGALSDKTLLSTHRVGTPLLLPTARADSRGHGERLVVQTRRPQCRSQPVSHCWVPAPCTSASSGCSPRDVATAASPTTATCPKSRYFLVVCSKK